MKRILLVLTGFGLATVMAGLFAQQSSVGGGGGGGSGGETNTMSSLGGGISLYGGKSGVDLRLNSLAAGTGVNISSNANLLTFSSAVAAEFDTTQFGTNATGLVILTNGAVATNLIARGRIELPLGSDAALSERAENDPNTGYFYNGSDRIDFVLGGTRHVSMTTSQLLVDNGASLQVNSGNVVGNGFQQTGVSGLRPTYWDASGITAAAALFSTTGGTGDVGTARQTIIGNNSAAATTFKGVYGTNGVTVASVANNTSLAISMAPAYRTLWVDAGAMVPHLTTGAETSTSLYVGGAMSDEMFFDDASDESVQARFVLDHWNAGTIKAKLYWTSGASSGDVIWTVAGMSAHDEDNFGTESFGTAQSVTDTATGNGDLQITAATASITIAGSPVAESAVWLSVSRDADNGSDTLTGDAKLLGLLIQYQESSTEVAAW